MTVSKHTPTLRLKRSHTHTHTHTQAHKHTHIYIHTHMDARSQSQYPRWHVPGGVTTNKHTNNKETQQLILVYVHASFNARTQLPNLEPGRHLQELTYRFCLKPTPTITHVPIHAHARAPHPRAHTYIARKGRNLQLKLFALPE